MSPSTVESPSVMPLPHAPGGRAADWRLRLDADAWVLTTPAGTRRQPLDGAPALQLERFEHDLPVLRGTRLNVVLGDGWLRYLVLRWPTTVRKHDERQAYLAHRFREVHGVVSPEWVWVLERDTVSFPRLVCAVPAALLRAVQAFADRRRLHLASVTGEFVACFNALLPEFREPRGVFGALAVARGGRVTVGLWRDAAWQALSSQPVGEGTGAGAGTVQRMLEGWCAAATGTGEGAARADPPHGVLYALGLEASAPAGWEVRGEEGLWV